MIVALLIVLIVMLTDLVNVILRSVLQATRIMLQQSYAILAHQNAIFACKMDQGIAILEDAGMDLFITPQLVVVRFVPVVAEIAIRVAQDSVIYIVVDLGSILI